MPTEQFNRAYKVLQTCRTTRFNKDNLYQVSLREACWAFSGEVSRRTFIEITDTTVKISELETTQAPDVGALECTSVTPFKKTPSSVSNNTCKIRGRAFLSTLPSTILPDHGDVVVRALEPSIIIAHKPCKARPPKSTIGFQSSLQRSRHMRKQAKKAQSRLAWFLSSICFLF